MDFDEGRSEVDLPPSRRGYAASFGQSNRGSGGPVRSHSFVDRAIVGRRNSGGRGWSHRCSAESQLLGLVCLFIGIRSCGASGGNRVRPSPETDAGGNAIYPASVIRREPPQSSDTEWIFHTRLRKAGIPVAIRPELDVRFSSPPRPGEYFAERFWLSRTIGASGGVPKLLFAPLLPLLLMARIALASMKKPRLLFRFVASAPVIFVLSAIQAAGEFTGSLGGKPK